MSAPLSSTLSQRGSIEPSLIPSKQYQPAPPSPELPVIVWRRLDYLIVQERSKKPWVIVASQNEKAPAGPGEPLGVRENDPDELPPLFHNSPEFPLKRKRKEAEVIVISSDEENHEEKHEETPKNALRRRF